MVILMETIGISVMVSIGLLLFFLAGMLCHDHMFFFSSFSTIRPNYTKVIVDVVTPAGCWPFTDSLIHHRDSSDVGHLPYCVSSWFGYWTIFLSTNWIFGLILGFGLTGWGYYLVLFKQFILKTYYHMLATACEALSHANYIAYR